MFWNDVLILYGLIGHAECSRHVFKWKAFLKIVLQRYAKQRKLGVGIHNSRLAMESHLTSSQTVLHTPSSGKPLCTLSPNVCLDITWTEISQSADSLQDSMWKWDPKSTDRSTTFWVKVWLPKLQTTSWVTVWLPKLQTDLQVCRWRTKFKGAQLFLRPPYGCDWREQEDTHAGGGG